eukprot:15356436-Ditylum_brightwellii.AAC.1
MSYSSFPSYRPNKGHPIHPPRQCPREYSSRGVISGLQKLSIQHSHKTPGNTRNSVEISDHDQKYPMRYGTIVSFSGKEQCGTILCDDDCHSCEYTFEMSDFIFASRHLTRAKEILRDSNGAGRHPNGTQNQIGVNDRVSFFQSGKSGDGILGRAIQVIKLENWHLKDHNDYDNKTRSVINKALLSSKSLIKSKLPPNRVHVYLSDHKPHDDRK